MKQIINNVSKELLPVIKLNLIIKTINQLVSTLVTGLLFIIIVWFLYKVIFETKIIFRL